MGVAPCNVQTAAFYLTFGLALDHWVFGETDAAAVPAASLSL